MTHSFSRLPVVPVLVIAFLGGCAAHEMAGDGSRRALATEVEAHLMSKLDVWYPRVIDADFGGFLTDFTHDWSQTENQNKMIVTQSRHLWTLSKAGLAYPERADEYAGYAGGGFKFLREQMWDDEYGGFFQTVTREGVPIPDQAGEFGKRLYGNAFAIYGLAAYYRFRQDPLALELAQRAFRWLEERSHDKDCGGYFEPLARDGTPTTSGFPKDYNSGIHILEALAELYSVWPDSLVRERLSEMFHITELPISLAWDAFGEKNGAQSLNSVRERIGRLRKEAPRPWEDYSIGCILLSEPFFWKESDWISGPPGWKGQIVRGRTYDLREEPGLILWRQVTDRLLNHRDPFTGLILRDPQRPDGFGGYGEPGSIPRRIGQGIFSAIVRDVYGRSCAISRERALPALEAAHIRPFSEVGHHSIRNGILLRSDVHKLFDAGYLTVTPEYRVEASVRMRDDFNDGENCLALHGRKIWIPEKGDLQPDPEALRWHNNHRFRGER